MIKTRDEIPLRGRAAGRWRSSASSTAPRASPSSRSARPSRGPTGSRRSSCRFRRAAPPTRSSLRDAAQLAWIVNLGCIDLNPHPIRADDLDHPDELRVDLDPVPGVPWDDVRSVALVANEVLDRPRPASAGPRRPARAASTSTCASSARWTFDEVRRAALALAREVERRAPDIATSKWWKEERHGVFLDYNQNAKDRTVASAYSVRPLPDARVSMPLRWDQVADVDRGGLHAGHGAGDLRPRRRRPRRHRRGGRLAGRAARAVGARREARAWATRRGRPTTASRTGEPPRVQPSRQKRADADYNTPEAEAAAREGARRDGAALRAHGRRARRRLRPRADAHRPARLDQAARSRSRARPRRTRRWPASSAGRRATPTSSSYLQPADVLVDSMRGRNTTWTRIRLNLEHVPEDKRPAQEPLEVDYDPWVEWLGPDRSGQLDAAGAKAQPTRQRARQPRRKWLPGKSSPSRLIR